MGHIQEEWLIYFYEDGVKNRYTKYLWWLKKGFTHCGGLKFDAERNIWLHLQFTHAGIKLDVLTPEEASGLFNYLHKFKILKCPIKDNWQFIRFKDMTCVSFVMRLIGFYKWYILTPHQLYCALINAGYSSFWKHESTKTKITTRID
jgi:hypothetical protein